MKHGGLTTQFFEDLEMLRHLGILQHNDGTGLLTLQRLERDHYTCLRRMWADEEQLLQNQAVGLD